MPHNPSIKKHNLKPGDGMSRTTSTKEQRAKVISRLQDLESPDCTEYGFYMGKHFPGPIPDYDGTGILREISLTDISK